MPADTVRHQVIGSHDIAPTFVALAGGTFEPHQMLDGVSLAPVLLGQRGDDQPVGHTLLIQSGPDRDARSAKARGSWLSTSSTNAPPRSRTSRTIWPSRRI